MLKKILLILSLSLQIGLSTTVYAGSNKCGVFFKLSAEKAKFLSNQDVIYIKNHDDVIRIQKLMDMTTRLLMRSSVKKFLKRQLVVALKGRDISEGQLLLILRLFPKDLDIVENYLNKTHVKVEDRSKHEQELAKVIREKVDTAFKNKQFLEKFTQLNDPVKTIKFAYANGKESYESIGETLYNEKGLDIKTGKIYEADDILAATVDFLDMATEVIKMNVYEFDSKEILNKLIEKAKDGLDITVGLDLNEKLIGENAKEERFEVYKLLKDHGVTVVEVDAVKINHQKIIIIDPHLEGKAHTAMLSGNFTNSDIHAGGDLTSKGLAIENAKPNLNSMDITKSDIFTIIVEHELNKTLVYKLKGTRGDNAYPISSLYNFRGDKGHPEYYKVIGFAPNGNITEKFLSKMLAHSSGRLEIMSFAFSTLFEQINARIIQNIKTTGKPLFRAIGDRKFAISDTGTPLRLSFLDLVKDKEYYKTINGKRVNYKSVAYMPIKNNEIKKLLSEEDYREYLDSIRVAPSEYFDTFTVVDAQGKEYVINRFIHNKGMVSGDLVISGSSFNFSKSAEFNTEQIALAYHKANADNFVRRMNYLFYIGSSKDSITPLTASRAKRKKKKSLKRAEKAALD